jgi:adenine-specific DNA-methyltransferase
MPTLNWIGKEKVVNHHRDVPFRVLEHKYHFECPPESEAVENGKGLSAEAPAQAGNMIIHGDNLEALKALLPKYEGKIKCIYIDPPYNTGNEGWVYNDNVNHPKIKKWLGDVVGKEGDDLTRHDKWLCMMYPRIKLLHQLLAKEGAIFISIDDNEQANLKLMCDEIFGPRNFLVNSIWEKSDSPKMDSKHFSVKHDHVLVFCKNIDDVQINFLQTKEEDLKHYNKIDSEGRTYYLKPLRAMGGQGETREARPSLYYPITDPEGNEVYPKRKDGSDGAWRWSPKKLKDESDRIEWTKGEKGWNPNYKIFASANSFRPPESIWYHNEVGSNRTSNSQLFNILGKSSHFNTPKPSGLVERILHIASDKDSIILDSFAGSGTTAHAVMNLNKQDGGNRKFILVEMEDYAETITAERVKRVAKGYGEGKKAVEGTGGSFDYYTLGEPLFVGENKEYLNEAVGTEKIREYIWYSETRTALPVIARIEERMTKQSNGNGGEPHYLGNKDQTAYYFFYEPQQVTTLDYDFLATIKTKAEQYVIYADNCLLSKAYMSEHSIIFKKIPRDISRF